MQPAGAGWGSASLSRLGSLCLLSSVPYPMPHFPLPPSHGTPLPLLANPKPLGQLADRLWWGRGRRSPVATDRPSPATRNVGAQAGAARGLWARRGVAEGAPRAGMGAGRVQPIWETRGGGSSLPEVASPTLGPQALAVPQAPARSAPVVRDAARLQGAGPGPVCTRACPPRAQSPPGAWRARRAAFCWLSSCAEAPGWRKEVSG